MNVATTLALDTAGPVCSVALTVNGGVVERAVSGRRAHADHVLALVESVLSAGDVRLGDVQALVFGEGPGGLTGVRVAASVVQAFAFATGATILAVSNLDALAVRLASMLPSQVPLLVAHDAGAGAVCARRYLTGPGGTLSPAGRYVVLAPDQLVIDDARIVVAGGASERLVLPAGAAWLDGEPTFARAADLLAAVASGLARAVAPEDAQPLYVRHPVDATISV